MGLPFFRDKIILRRRGGAQVGACTPQRCREAAMTVREPRKGGDAKALSVVLAKKEMVEHLGFSSIKRRALAATGYKFGQFFYILRTVYKHSPHAKFKRKGKVYVVPVAHAKAFFKAGTGLRSGKFQHFAGRL